MQIRPAMPDDADLLVQVIDIASEGVVPSIWAGYAPEGADPMEVVRAAVLADGGPFSFRSGWVIEADGRPVGAMIGYVLPDPPAPPDPGVPPVFVPVTELEAQAAGYWLINIVAVLPEARGRGYGGALVSQAAKLAKAVHTPGVALIVAASNEGAMRLYCRCGFHEAGRRVFDVRAFGRPLTEAVLMIKPV